MKRKIIQVGESTQLVSLPRKWCLEHKLKRGDEVDVELEKNRIIISKDVRPEIRSVEFKTADVGSFLTRYIHGLYKRGVDEIKIHFKDASEFARVQETLSKDVGFEIVEQGLNYCKIKSISGDIESFDQLLRRVFIMLMNMADEGYAAMKSNNIKQLSSLLALEEANNRFTLSCRRHLNRKGHPELRVGPLYYVVEELERIADEIKYFFEFMGMRALSKQNRAVVIGSFADIADAIRTLSECFYTFDAIKLSRVHTIRKRIMEKWNAAVRSRRPNPELIAALHHLTILAIKLGNLTGLFVALRD